MTLNRPLKTNMVHDVLDVDAARALAAEAERVRVASRGVLLTAVTAAGTGPVAIGQGIGYVEGVRDALAWLAGDDPTNILTITLEA